MSLRPFAGLLCLSVGALVAAAPADEPKKPAPTTTQTPPAKYQSAATIDFTAALGLDWNSLCGLGARIEEARKSGDPVALANAAAELSAAEKVSGKTASLTGDALLKEAVALAKLRDHSTELKGVALLLKDEKEISELEKAAAEAEKREKDAAAAFKAGEKSKGADILFVENYHDYAVDVYVDGDFVGNLPGNYQRTYYIYKKHNSVTLTAYGSGYSFGPYYIDGDWDKFTWKLQ